MKNYIKIHEDDNVIVALKYLSKGFLIEEYDIILDKDIEMGHKIAISSIKKGQKIIKYGFPIGHALTEIKKGEHVHTHNLSTDLDGKLSYTYSPINVPKKDKKSATFMGFERDNNEVGVRNDIWIIPTVGCVNSVALAIAQKAKNLVKGTVDNVIAFTHPYGCSQMGEDLENTKAIITGLAKHPNAGGVLLLGLGCEYCGAEVIEPLLGEYNKEKIKLLISQDVENEVDKALDIIKELIEGACQNKRTPVPIDKLVIGLKCGGSDGLSGVTANPVVGKFSDILVEYGGSAVLTEVPEMFGAETILMDRAKNQAVFEKIVTMINDFKQFFADHNMVIYENPSPGNKRGGISTLEDKSLGCTQKSGSSNICDVVNYAQKVSVKGLNLMNCPSNDLVATTALAAGGAQIVLFTTGRGTPFAGPVPTVKISTNSPLATKKSNWIDFDAGVVVDEIEIEQVGQELFEKVIKIAEGEKIMSEKHDYYDLAIFKKGVTL